MIANLGFARPLAALGLLAMLGAAPGICSRRGNGRAAGAGRSDGGSRLSTPGAGPMPASRSATTSPATTTTPTTEIDTDGFVGGVFGGYNVAERHVRLRRSKAISATPIPAARTLSRQSTTSSVDGSLRARMGVAVTDDVLLYATAGGAGQSLKISDPAGSDRKTHARLDGRRRCRRQDHRTGLRSRRISLHRLQRVRLQHRQRHAVDRFERKPRQLRRRHEVLKSSTRSLQWKAGPRARLFLIHEGR